MSNETNKKPPVKETFLTFLSRLSGNPKGADKEKLLKATEKRTGAKRQTLLQYLKEQSGQLKHNRKGRIIVLPRAKIISTTSQAPLDHDTSDGSGTHRGSVPWTWRK